MKTFPSPTRHGNGQVRNGELVDADAVPAGEADTTQADAAATVVPESAPAPAEQAEGAEAPEPTPKRRRKSADH